MVDAAVLTLADFPSGWTEQPAEEVPEFGDQSAGFHITIAVRTQGQDLEVHLDTVVVRVGRGGTEVQAMSIGAPYDTAHLEELVGVAVQRMQEQMADAGL